MTQSRYFVRVPGLAVVLEKPEGRSPEVEAQAKKYMERDLWRNQGRKGHAPLCNSQHRPLRQGVGKILYCRGCRGWFSISGGAW